MVAFSTKTVHDIYITPSWKQVSMEHQQFLVLHFGVSKQHTDISANNRTIDCLYRQKQNIYKEQHGSQHNRWRKLENIQKAIIHSGCKAVYPYMAAYESIWEDTVAHVDVVI